MDRPLPPKEGVNIVSRRKNRLGRLDTLLDMLEFCRPAGSPAENVFIRRYIACLPNAEVDPHGNWHVTVDDAPVLWSCHTDTVHDKGGKQSVQYDPKTGVICLGDLSLSSCLGADCTAGVFLMTEMIKAKVPGHYVFHFAEEMGGVGSSALAAANPDFLRMFDMAIALDRQGFTDVITYQAGGRCASDAFAASLAAALGTQYRPCDRGVFTDTAEYTDLIPECTNIAVGYRFQHTWKEELDSVYLLKLLDRLIKLDVTKLVIERDPTVSEYEKEWTKWDRWTDDDYTKWVKGGKPSTALAHLDDDGGTLLDDYRTDNYLDPAYADVQRALAKMERENAVKVTVAPPAAPALKLAVTDAALTILRTDADTRAKRAKDTLFRETEARRLQEQKKLDTYRPVILPGIVIKEDTRKKGNQ